MGENSVRLNKVIREFNISLERVVEFLSSRGHEIDARPTSKISDEQYSLLSQEFSSDRSSKVESHDLSEEKKKENEERIKEVMYLKKEIEKEKIILKLIDKDGLPLYLLMKKMEPMEKQMNELISPFLPDKKIRFYIDQKTTLEVHKF